MLLLLRFLRFFTFFFQNPKKRDFLRFFALLHTFSRTMVAGTTRADDDADRSRRRDVTSATG